LNPVCGYHATNRASVRRIKKGSHNVKSIEQGYEFLPKFDVNGLVTAVVQDQGSSEVLMVAFMDQEALDRTRDTGLAHFHSRSRNRLWMKGESSGHTLAVEAIRVDCDQDALVLMVRPAGPACHTGARTCFYRALEGDVLTRVEA
jgi:phosphoribosyl-AMP cyclohydrolase